MSLSKMTDEMTSNKVYLDMYQALQDPVIRKVLEIPMLVLVAGQSAGKSFLISHIAQYLITYMDPSIGTRRPVRYDFRNSDDVGNQGITVGGVACEISEVAQRVKEAMLYLQASNRFSSEELEVIICVPGAQNLIIVDMPGFPDKQKSYYSETKGLIVEMLRNNPKAIIVAVIDATSTDAANRGNSAGFDEVLGEVRPHWREGSIFINNKINMSLPHLSTYGQLRSYFEPVAGKDEYYVILHPASGTRAKDIHAMSTEEVSTYIRDTRSRGEEAALNQLLQDVVDREGGPASGAEFLASLRATFKFGVNALERGLHKRIHEEIIAQLPLITEKLETLRQRAAGEIDTIDAQLAFHDPTTTRDLYHKYIFRITQVMRIILDHESFGHSHEEKNLNVAKYAMRFEAELLAAHGEAQDEIPLEYKDIVETLGNYRDSHTSLLKQVRDMLLGGYAAGNRMLLVYGLQLLSVQLEASSLADMFGAAVAPMSGAIGEANFNKMVMQDLRPNIGKLEKLTPWLKNHLAFLLTRLYACAEDFLMNHDKRFEPIRDHHDFHYMLQQHYKDMVKTRTAAIAETVNGMIRDHKTIFSLDSSYRSIPMMALAPNGDLASDLLHRIHRNSSRERTRSRSHSVHVTSPATHLPPVGSPVAETAASPAGPANPADPAASQDTADADSASSEKTLTPKQRGLRGLHGAVLTLSPNATHEVDKSGVTSVAVCLSEIITSVQTYDHTFDLLDVLKLDTEHYSNEPLFSLDPSNASTIANRHFFFVRIELYKSVERAVQAQFVYFNNQYLDDFYMSLSNALGAFSNEQLFQYSGFEHAKMVALKARLADEHSLVAKLAALQASLQKFYRAHLWTPTTFEPVGSLGILASSFGSHRDDSYGAPRGGGAGGDYSNGSNRRGGKRGGGGSGGGNGGRAVAAQQTERVLADPDVSGEVVQI